MIGIHHLLKKQLPEFVREKYPTFCTFLDYYYRWLTAHGFGRLKDITDIDTMCDTVLILNLDSSTFSQSELESFIGYELTDKTTKARARVLGVSEDGKLLIQYITKDALFERGDTASLNFRNKGRNKTILIGGTYRIPTVFIDNFAHMLDANKIIDLTSENAVLLLKHIKEYYTMKGTEDAINFLLFSLRGIDSKIMYPWENVLKPSDGRWRQYYSIVLKTTKSNLALLTGEESKLEIINYGVQTSKSFNIKSIEFFKNEKYYEEDGETFKQYVRVHLYEKPSTVYFGYGSVCHIRSEKGVFEGTVDRDVVGVVVDSGSISSIDVSYGGSGYSNNVVAEVIDETGKGAKVSVTTFNGEVQGINIVNRGSGYSSNAKILITDKGGNGSGATATVSVTSGGLNWIDGEVFKIGGTDDWSITDNSYDISKILVSGNGRWFKRPDGTPTEEDNYNKVVNIYKSERAELPFLGRVTAIGTNGGVQSIEIIQNGEYISEVDEDTIYEISPLLFENRSSWDDSYNAFIRFKFGLVVNELGFWEDERGFLSYPDIVLQDSVYFQQFSYDVFTDSDNTNQQEILKDTHPAGTKQFNTQMMVDSWHIGDNIGFNLSFPYVLIENGYSEVVVLDEYSEYVDAWGNIQRRNQPQKIFYKSPFSDTTIAEEYDFRKTVIKPRNDIVLYKETDFRWWFTKVIETIVETFNRVWFKVIKRITSKTDIKNDIKKTQTKTLTDSSSLFDFIKKIFTKPLGSDGVNADEGEFKKTGIKRVESETISTEDTILDVGKKIFTSTDIQNSLVKDVDKVITDSASTVEEFNRTFKAFRDFDDTSKLEEVELKKKDIKRIESESNGIDDVILDVSKKVSSETAIQNSLFNTTRKPFYDTSITEDVIRSFSVICSFKDSSSSEDECFIFTSRKVEDAVNLEKADYGETDDGVFFVRYNDLVSVYTDDESETEAGVYTLDESGEEILVGSTCPLYYRVSNIGKVYTSPSGRKFYRHISDMGTVMEWEDNGVTRRTLIVDMAYHTTKTTYGSATDVADITNYTANPFKEGSTFQQHFVLGVEDSTTKSYEGQTDAVLDAKLNWADANTSLQNTDALIAEWDSDTYNYGANMCRAITVEGVGCDLPNMQTLLRMFCDRAILHQLDKTDTNNYWTTWFNKSDVLTSSEYDASVAWNISYSGGVWSDAKATYQCYIAPVLELDENGNVIKTVSNDILITLDGKEWTSDSIIPSTNRGYGWASRSYESGSDFNASETRWIVLTDAMGGPFGGISKKPYWNIGSNGLQLELTALLSCGLGTTFAPLDLRFDLTTDETTTDTISFNEIRLTNTTTGEYFSYVPKDGETNSVTDGTVLVILPNDFTETPTATSKMVMWLKSAYENNQKIKIEFTPAPDGYV